jgi:hypothetical protein
VSVPDLGLVDTVTLVVRPGNPAGITVAPKDSVITVNGTATLRGGATDSYGNVRSDPVTFSLLSGPATVSNAAVTGTAVGRASILLMSDSRADTAYLSVVPPGVLAAINPSSGVLGPFVFNLDGSSMQAIPTSPTAGNVRWAPSGTSLAFDQSSDGLTAGSASDQLQSITSAGVVTSLDVSPGYGDRSPQYAPNGAMIYYWKLGSPDRLWHVTPSGTNDDTVFMQNPYDDLMPSPSPDGSQLAYLSFVNGSPDLRILTLATGALTDLHLLAWAPVWAPSGLTIAYINAFAVQGPIALVNADGSGQRTLTTGTYYQDIDWSPDGQYIVAANVDGDLNLITVSTGTVLPLHYASGDTWYSPTWNRAAGASALRASRALAHK